MSATLSQHTVQDVTIAINTATSGQFRVAEYSRGSIQVPAAITGTSYTLEVSNDGETWDGLKVAAGTAVAAVNWAADDILPLPSSVFDCKFARIVSQASEAAARTIKVFLKG